MDYFEHGYISNSELKRLKSDLSGVPIYPDNIQEHFDFGTLCHQLILERHKADYNHPLYEVAAEMRDTFLDDDLCRMLLHAPDAKKEHEFYKQDLMGVPARCKMDLSSRHLSTILEFKGLGITTEKQFFQAIYRFDYDQGAAWYLEVTGFQRLIIVGVSKKKTDRLFKVLIDRDHPIYESGIQKAREWVEKYTETYGTYD